MNLNNFIYIFSFFNGIRNRKVTEGKQFFLKNYSGFSWHLRERRYLLMTRRGPVEYVFNLKHYLVCLSVFLFGLCSSLSILTSFIINVVKEDLVSTARATPIIVADFIDYRALVINNKTNKLNANLDKTYITFKNSNYAENKSDLPDFKLTVQNPVSPKALLFLIVMQLITSIILVAVIYLK